MGAARTDRRRNMDNIFELAVQPDNFDVLDPAIYNHKDDNSLALVQNSRNMFLAKANQQLAQSNEVRNFVKNARKKTVFGAKLSEKAQQMLREGKWEWKYSDAKEGYLPSLYNKATGRIAEQVSVDISKVPADVTGNVANLALQQMVGQLMEVVQEMNNSVQRIERGQRDDRISLYQSAKQQYIEAISLSTSALQEYALLNAAKTANDASSALMETMKSDVRIIAANKVNKKEIDKLVENVFEAMKFINEATGLKVACYAALGEEKSLLATLKNYQVFTQQILLSPVSDDKNALTGAEILHQNYNLKNKKDNVNKWLFFPKEIDKQVEKIIDSKTGPRNLIESEEN